MAGFMRIFVMFDLPTKTAEDKRNYCHFRKFLLRDGYQMLQYSVYCRIVNGLEGVEKHSKRIEKNMPTSGNVRLLKVTEKQYADMMFIVGEPTITEEKVSANAQIII